MAIAFKHGDHICAIYDHSDAQEAVAANYVAEGLRRGERCLYAAMSPASLGRFRVAAEALGIKTGTVLDRGALVLRINAEAHFPGGRFNSEAMLEMLCSEVETSLAAGFTGFRMCGDMSWLLDQPEGWQQVREYESLLNEFFQAVPACGMCQYDRRRLPSMFIDDALATHPSVVLDGVHQANPLFERTHPRPRRQVPGFNVTGRR